MTSYSEIWVCVISWLLWNRSSLCRAMERPETLISCNGYARLVRDEPRFFLVFSPNVRQVTIINHFEKVLELWVTSWFMVTSILKKHNEMYPYLYLICRPYIMCISMELSSNKRCYSYQRSKSKLLYFIVQEKWNTCTVEEM